MSEDYIAINPSNTSSPTAGAAGNHATGSYSKFPLLDERTAAILVAIGVPLSFLPTFTLRTWHFPLHKTTLNDVSADLHVGPGGKPGGRKNRKNRRNRKNSKNSNKHPVAKTTPLRTSNRVGKNKKNSATATASSGSARKSPPGSGKRKRAQQRDRDRKRSERENVERKKWLEDWFDSENKRKEEQAVDGLVELMEGFGICAGDKGQEEGMAEGWQEGIVMDMDGLERQMATLEVIREDGEGGL
ncbi:hypothetical protein B9Z19DRAFT_1068726 [Tuber borchii]|uniref:Uncharacterized protein n=1 Tax=Tuber borchii TaxID=42251 RepID=A0A2T6ZE53_TUBBO|nr:hypothetical protein B9Z19DRAFT_1068726 [Tuber borchii]